MNLNNNSSIDSAALDFLKEQVGDSITISLVSGDASFRRYFRVETEDARYILMDAPPLKEDSAPFLDLSRFLYKNGIPVPQVIAARLDLGFLLLDDFGDCTFLLALEQGESPDLLYRWAVDVLLDIQTTPVNGQTIAHERPYDRALLSRELALFTDWYLEGICKQSITVSDQKRFDSLFERVMEQVLCQPTCLVHRDYHSRNLMWRPQEQGRNRVGVLDFQDAVMGPVTYDLASLLRDCYVAWDRSFRDQISAWWLKGARDRLNYNRTNEEFERDFDWMALQRNLKAVGIFGRLSLRDSKHGYLKDIPRTMSYIKETIIKYPELDELNGLIGRYVP
ncbi:MAG: phosphotransferase [Magnetococcales bacterium]|nr:phosphotransferase [Magnetococcales bacterium]